MTGQAYGYVAETFYESDIEQKAFFEKGLSLLDKGVEFAKKAKDNSILMSIIFALMWWGFTSNKFDTVFMANLIHVIENPSLALQESYRILRDDGLLIITSFANHGMKPLEIIKLGFRFIKVWGKLPKYTHRFSPDSLGSLMESAGFSIEESKLLGDKTKTLYLIGKKK